MRTSRTSTEVRKRDEGLVVDLAEAPVHGGPTAYVQDVEQLVRVAKRYEAVVLRLRGTDGQATQYWVWDQGLLLTAGGGPSSTPAVRPGPAGSMGATTSATDESDGASPGAR